MNEIFKNALKYLSNFTAENDEKITYTVPEWSPISEFNGETEKRDWVTEYLKELTHQMPNHTAFKVEEQSLDFVIQNLYARYQGGDWKRLHLDIVQELCENFVYKTDVELIKIEIYETNPFNHFVIVYFNCRNELKIDRKNPRGFIEPIAKLCNCNLIFDTQYDVENEICTFKITG